MQSGDYSIGDHPIRVGTKVILMNPQGAARWEPKELPAFEFDFTTAGGLQEISGFFKGSQEEVTVSLIKRYGKHNHQVAALGMQAFGWEFDKTWLDLTYIYFKLTPMKPLLK